MDRKKALYKIVDHQKPTSIVEVGTWNGLNAISMVSIALKHNPEVVYYGFDLFEESSPDKDEAELNVKPHVSLEVVLGLFKEFKATYPGFTYQLFKGDTKTTLHQDGPWKTADFAFIDGGHSVDTVKSDYEALKQCKTVVFDDYYLPDDQGNRVDTSKFGCNNVVDSLNAATLPTRDKNTLGGFIGIAIIPPHHSPFPIKLKVQTRNCVDDVQAQANVKYSVTVHNRWAPYCKVHDGTAVMVSAGPSYLDYIDDIKALAALPNHYVFCVKTNHNDLIDRGIVPFGCCLLDPRPKVKRFIKPHPDVRYFAASVVHPSTIDLLHEYNLFLYNAPIGAGEHELYKTASTDMRSKRLVGGGTTTAGRALMLLRTMGFLKLKLYGYDSCFRDPQDQTETTKDGQKKYWEIEKFGKKFWTSLEMLAQVQDFERYFTTIVGDPSFDLEFFGDGIIPHIYNNVKIDKEEFSKDLFNAQS